MNIPRLSVRRPVTTMMVFLAVVLLGVVSFRQIPVQLLPDLSVPGLGISIYGNTGESMAETVESITRPVEGLVAEVPRVRRIRSWTGRWGVWVQVELEPGTDLRFATLDLQERLNRFQRERQDQRIVAQVIPFSTSEINQFLAEIALEGTEDREFLALLARDVVAPRLETLTGIARIEVGSTTRDAVEVRLDPARMSGFGIEFPEVLTRLNSAGTEDAYVGELRVPGERHFVYVDPIVRTIEDIRNLPLGPTGTIRLADVAEVVPAETIENRVYRSNGRMAVGIRVDREEGANLIEVARQLRREIEAINGELPGGAELVLQTDIADVVQSAIAEVRNLALIGAALALIVPLLFFRSWRIAGIVFLSVPICIVAVFNLFYFFGLSLNIFSIIGLALGVGMLVDNSIVVVENCFRISAEGKLDALTAAETGSAEVGRALFAATLTTCVPFLALFFVDGEFGLIVREPTMALVFPLLVSLGVAMTLSAMLTSRALMRTAARSLAARQPKPSHLVRLGNQIRLRYRRLLKTCLRHRGTLLVVIAGVVVMTFLDACDRVEQSSIAQDQTPNVFRIYAEMAPGTEMAETSAIVAQIEARLAEYPDVERFGTWFRSGSATIDITLKPPDERPSGQSLARIRSGMIDQIGDVAGAELSLEPPEAPLQPGPSVAGGEMGILEVKGIDYDSLIEYAERVAESLLLLPEVATARVSIDSPTEELRGLIDRERSQLFELQAQTIGQFIGATASGGQISRLILREGERRTDVTVVVEGTEVTSIDAVRAIPVVTGDRTRVNLGDLLALETERVPGGRRRVDRMATVNLEYTLNRGTNQRQFRPTIREVVNTVPNPAGVIVEEGGEQARIDERQRDFLFVLFVGVLFIYIVMAAAFESFWVPFTILLTNPLMLIGIVFALAITGLPFEELAAFGVILLNGLAVNNGIVMMDTVMRLRREKGASVKRAMLQAADQRLRPIVMTFLTTTFGLLPLAISGSEDSQWQPVAVTVLGGLTTATILMLFVLPCIYLVGEDVVGFLRPRAHRAARWILLGTEKIVNAAVAVLWALPRPWRWPRALHGLPVFWRGMRRLVSFLVRAIVLPFRIARILAGDAHSLLRRPRGAEDEMPGEDRLSTRVVPMMAMEDLEVRTRNLRATFRVAGGREVVALRGVSSHLRRGLVGVVGPNGAGKTTLMRLIAGVLEPDRGSVRVCMSMSGVTASPASLFVSYLPQRVGAGPETVGVMLEESALDSYRAAALWTAAFESPPPASRFLEGAMKLGDPAFRARRIRQALQAVNLEQEINSPLSTLSGGMRRRASLAAALLADKPILLVDEPTAGLDPNERLRVRLLLADYSRSALVLLSTHIIEDIDGYCDQLLLLNHGACIFAGPVEDVAKSNDLVFWEVDERDRESVQASHIAEGFVVSRTVHAEHAVLLFAGRSAPEPLAQGCRKATLEEWILALIKRSEG